MNPLKIRIPAGTFPLAGYCRCTGLDVLALEGWQIVQVSGDRSAHPEGRLAPAAARPPAAGPPAAGPPSAGPPSAGPGVVRYLLSRAV